MEGLSPGILIAWQAAAAEAQLAGSKFIEPEHLLLGICSLRKAVEQGVGGSQYGLAAVEALRTENRIVEALLGRFGVDQQSLRYTLRRHLSAGNALPPGGIMHRSERCKRLFDELQRRANRGTPPHVADLMELILRDPVDQVNAALAELKVDPGVLMEALSDVRAGSEAGQPVEQVPTGAPAAKGQGLERFGRDLTALAREGKLSPVIGRREEMLQLVRIISRQRKNCPVLIGEAGVGKTAVVEGLAHRIAQGKNLPDHRIVEINMGAVVAGTRYRGEFEERLLGLLDEARQTPNLILFLDEMHTLIGAGAAEGSLDASNILKPALARGDICCIGCTTTTEYRRHVEDDPALERRFQPVRVLEPSPQEAVAMLQELRPTYEAHHNVTIRPDAVQAAVELTVRHVQHRQLPDKALDALEEACVAARVPELSGPLDGSCPDPDVTVTAEDIAEVVSAWTGVATADVKHDNLERLRTLEQVLQQRVLGQETAVRQVCESIRRSSIGFTIERPRGVFFFLGPTGVGKTHLAKSLAEAIFDSDRHVIRIDMSEYQEAHSVARLIGSPPGYVGYGEEGQLTGPLRSRPCAVVLLDEIEKAHANVFDLLLQLLGEGRITDGKGRTVTGTHAVFIMTSNLIYRQRIGFGKDGAGTNEETAVAAARQMFRPEFINRVDQWVVFEPLQRPTLESITRQKVDMLRRQLMEKYRMNLTVSDDAVALIARLGDDGQSGARGVQRILERDLEGRIADLMIYEQPGDGSGIVVEARDDSLTVDVTPG